MSTAKKQRKKNVSHSVSHEAGENSGLFEPNLVTPKQLAKRQRLCQQNRIQPNENRPALYDFNLPEGPTSVADVTTAHMSMQRSLPGVSTLYLNLGDCTTPRGFCAMLLDVQGNAIQANMSRYDITHFDQTLKLQSAYRITDFFCEPTNPLQCTVPNETSIMLGKYATIQEIPADDFPDHYFQFISYSELNQRLPRPSILTDYMGSVEHVGNMIKHGNPNTRQKVHLDLRLSNINNDVVLLTLWNEQANNFNITEYEQLPKPVILAVSSCWVNNNSGKLQLTGTPATCCYFNPAIPEYLQSINAYVEKLSASPLLNIDRNRYKDINEEKKRNRYPLIELCKQKKDSYQQERFTCEGTVVEFDDTKTWYYNSCSKCKKKVILINNINNCANHGEQPDNFCYCFKAFITDGTATAPFTFFSEKGTMVIGNTCESLVVGMGHQDKRQIPPPMKVFEGTTHILQFHYGNGTYKGIPEFVIDKVFKNDNTSADNQAENLQPPTTTTPSKPGKDINIPETPNTTTFTPPPTASPPEQIRPSSKRVLQFAAAETPANNSKKKKE